MAQKAGEKTSDFIHGADNTKRNTAMLKLLISTFFLFYGLFMALLGVTFTIMLYQQGIELVAKSELVGNAATLGGFVAIIIGSILVYYFFKGSLNLLRCVHMPLGKPPAAPAIEEVSEMQKHDAVSRSGKPSPSMNSAQQDNESNSQETLNQTVKMKRLLFGQSDQIRSVDSGRADSVASSSVSRSSYGKKMSSGIVGGIVGGSIVAVIAVWMKSSLLNNDSRIQGLMIEPPLIHFPLSNWKIRNFGDISFNAPFQFKTDSNYKDKLPEQYRGLYEYCEFSLNDDSAIFQVVVARTAVKEEIPFNLDAAADGAMTAAKNKAKSTGRISNSISPTVTTIDGLTARRASFSVILPKTIQHVEGVFIQSGQKWWSVTVAYLGDSYALDAKRIFDSVHIDLSATMPPQEIEKPHNPADLGNAKGQNNRGNGDATDNSLTIADAKVVKSYRTAAEQGNAKAQLMLGNRYATGQGMDRDEVLAYMWFNLSAAAGNADGAKAREETGKDMTPGQITEAQRMSLEWKSKN